MADMLGEDSPHDSGGGNKLLFRLALDFISDCSRKLHLQVSLLLIHIYMFYVEYVGYAIKSLKMFSCGMTVRYEQVAAPTRKRENIGFLHRFK